MAAIESASCAARSATVRPRTIRPPISRPAVTAALDASSATTPAARLVIQKTCSDCMAQDCAVVTAPGSSDEEVAPPSEVVATCGDAVVAACAPIDPWNAITPQ